MFYFFMIKVFDNGIFIKLINVEEGMQFIGLYYLFIISICIRLIYFLYIDLVQYVQILMFYCIDYDEKLYFVMISLDNLYWLVGVLGQYGLWVQLG